MNADSGSASKLNSAQIELLPRASVFPPIIKISLIMVGKLGSILKASATFVSGPSVMRLTSPKNETFGRPRRRPSYLKNLTGAVESKDLSDSVHGALALNPGDVRLRIKRNVVEAVPAVVIRFVVFVVGHHQGLAGPAEDWNLQGGEWQKCT